MMERMYQGTLKVASIGEADGYASTRATSFSDLTLSEANQFYKGKMVFLKSKGATRQLYVRMHKRIGWLVDYRPKCLN